MNCRQFNERLIHQKQQLRQHQLRHQHRRQSETRLDPSRQLHLYEDNYRKLSVSVQNDYYYRQQLKCRNQETRNDLALEREEEKTLTVEMDTTVIVHDRRAVLVRPDENAAPVLVVIARDANVATAVDRRAAGMSDTAAVHREIAALRALVISARFDATPSSRGPRHDFRLA